MFDNILHQSASELLSDDIKKERLPGSILFSGPASSGKLSCALELARVMSCQIGGEKKGEWNCTCPSCLKHKALVSQNVIITGPGNRTLEIKAAKNTFLSQNVQNTKHLEASRYLYLRAVRKLTARFSPVLWEGEDKLSKFSPLLQKIDESLELLTPGRTVPEPDELEKILNDVEENCLKLEESYLYKSLPVSQIRNFSSWAHLTSSNGKKVLIIENAERMQDSARNALLKILEEPPKDTVFILTTSNRGAVLQTILSRVRTYNFYERNTEHQREVIDRVFHFDPSFAGGVIPETVDKFLQNYLSIQPSVVYEYSEKYFKTIAEGHVPDIPLIVSACNNFSPRVLFKIFLEGITEAQKVLCSKELGSQGAECSALVVKELREVLNNVTVFNLNPASALEELARNLMQINYLNGGVFKRAYERVC
mgnify:FL=1